MRILFKFAALPLLILTGCSGVMDSAQPARQYFMLMPLSESSTPDISDQKPSLTMVLGAVPGLDTDWVQALDGDAQLVRYANARWPDHLPEVLTSVIQRSLQASGRYAEVRAASRAAGDAWFLQLEVQQFYGLQDTNRETTRVAVRISGAVTCDDQHSAFTVEDTVPVNSQRLSAVITAHQQGLDKITQQIFSEIKKVCQ
ncbi:MAG: membrane integrity-associated transporter subunit PqiC [Gammaproteobacteria bacterium]|nr:membrane integrity-associated transporter subunit PqiC [Gammaproteobacteria bacterium]MBT8053965.1 membrane integrity-associated transporter subunit PqiC [Gammaproteobacteria bacterium]